MKTVKGLHKQLTGEGGGFLSPYENERKAASYGGSRGNRTRGPERKGSRGKSAARQALLKKREDRKAANIYKSKAEKLEAEAKKLRDQEIERDLKAIMDDEKLDDSQVVEDSQMSKAVWALCWAMLDFFRSMKQKKEEIQLTFLIFINQ